MRRTPLKRKRTTKRRVTTPRCATLRCTRRLVPGSTLCVQHLEARADRLFSSWVRERDLACTFPDARVIGTRRCGVTNPTHAAHIVGRRNKAVRFDPENVWALCPAHHVMVDQHGREHAKYDWAVSLLGEDGFTALRERAREPKPRITAALDALAWLEEAA